MPPLAAEGLARFGNSLPEPNRRAACHPSSGSTDGCTCPHPTKPNLLRKRLGRHYNGFFAPIAALRPCSLFRLLKRKGPLTHLSDPGRFYLNKKVTLSSELRKFGEFATGFCRNFSDAGTRPRPGFLPECWSWAWISRAGFSRCIGKV